MIRSLKQLIETIDDLEGHEIGFHSLTKNIDTTTGSDRLVFYIFASSPRVDNSRPEYRLHPAYRPENPRRRNCQLA